MLVAITAVIALPSPLAAHDGPPPSPDDIWSAWNLDPLIVALLAASIAIYMRGVRTGWRRAGVARSITRANVAAWAGGVLALAIALVSPVDALGAALFAGHMVQHLLLVLVAAPLLVLGAPHLAILWALPPRARIAAARWWARAPTPRTLRRVFGHLVVATVLHAIAIWAWHAPPLYEAALRHDGWHALEHASFFLTALLFWWVVVRAPRRRAGVAVLAIFVTAMQSGVLGALLSFSPTPWYLGHGATAGSWGLGLLEDQQLAGLIMWIPASVVYILAAMLVLWRWLERPLGRSAASSPVVAPTVGCR